MKTYSFTAQQLGSLLHSTIEMFQEYRDVHGKNELMAQHAAVEEMFDGLNSEVDLVRHGEKFPVTLQILDVEKLRREVTTI